MKISESTHISMPVRNLISIVAAVAVGVWAYFGIVERINNLETSKQLMEADLLKRAEQKPKNLEMLMLIEMNAKMLEKHQKQLDENISIRKGKYGPYVFYKTNKMKKPKFIPMKGIKVEEVTEQWVKDKL